MPIRRTFDFAVAEASTSPLAWLALIGGSLLFAMAADRYVAAADEHERLVRQEERLKRKAGAAAPFAAQSASAEKSVPAGRRDIPSAFPWDEMLREVELAADSRVAFLGLDTDASQRRSRISAEARNIEDALAFAARLADSPLAGKVLLLSHETKKNRPVPVIDFALQVDWSVE
jgi:hypothetical protein